MIVVVTGGTGYVGRYVAAHCLSKGWQVHLLTRPGSVIPEVLNGQVFKHEIGDSVATLTRVLTETGAQCLLHLASAPPGAHTPESAARLLESNIRFPTLLLEAMRASSLRCIVNTGTFWQHYNGSRYWPTDFYAATKQAFEDLLSYYTDQHEIRAVTLKLYDTYGADDPRGRIVTGLVEATKSGVTLDLSAGEQVLDLTHVEDIGAAFATAAERVCGLPARSNETFFISGERLSLRQLVAMIDGKSGGRLNVRLGARPYRNREIMQPIVPGNRTLPGWAPDRAVASTVDAMLAAS